VAYERVKPTCYPPHPCLDLPNVRISGFLAESLNSLLSPVCNTCPTDLTFLDVIIAMISGELFKSFRYSLCIFLPRPVTSSQFGPNIFLTKIFPRHIFSPLSVTENVPACYEAAEQLATSRKRQFLHPSPEHLSE